MKSAVLPSDRLSCLEGATLPGTSRRQQRGFTLVEMLVVMSIALLAAALVVPAIVAILDGRKVAEAAELVARQLQLARQEARGKGLTMEVRFLEKDDKWFALQTFQVTSGSSKAVSRFTRLPEGIVITGISPTTSPLIASAPQGAVMEVPGAGTCNWRALRFDSGGEAGPLVSGTQTILLNGTNNFLTVVVEKAWNAKGGGSELPSNYATIQVIPATGRAFVFRP